MKIIGLCMALWLVGVVLQSFNGFNGGLNGSIMQVSGMMIVGSNTMAAQAASRDLMEKGCGGSFDGDVSVEDYRPYDPSPSSKASVRPGPIEHSTPLMPHIPNPKPSPPHYFDQEQCP